MKHSPSFLFIAALLLGNHGCGAGDIAARHYRLHPILSIGTAG